MIVGLFVGGSGKARLLRFSGITGRLGNGAGGPALSLTAVGKSDVSSTADCLCDGGFATDGTGDVATASGLLFSPVCRVLDTGVGGKALPAAVGKSDALFTEDSFDNCGIATDDSDDAATINDLLLSTVCTVLDGGTGGTALPAAVGKFDILFTADSFCA